MTNFGCFSPDPLPLFPLSPNFETSGPSASHSTAAGLRVSLASGDPWASPHRATRGEGEGANTLPVWRRCRGTRR